jgi:ribosomal protein S3
LESTPNENRGSINLDEPKDETSSSLSNGHKGKRKIFFVTKSLAEVYAKQGHISVAVEIYRKMLGINPSDIDIEKRIAELESHPSAKRSIKSKEQET